MAQEIVRDYRVTFGRNCIWGSLWKVELEDNRIVDKLSRNYFFLQIFW